MSYTHLSASERFTLYRLRIQENLSLSAIATAMKRCKSTISRELKRNRVDATLYLPDSAHRIMQTRRQTCKHRFMSICSNVVEQLKQRLMLYHSPEQICGRLRHEGLASISPETVYQMVYANHKGLAQYQCYLRQGHKTRHRRQNLHKKRGRIPGRVGIEHRPSIAQQKTHIGHWESDTVIGANHTGVLVTHVDKASKFLLAGLAKHKTVEQINSVTLKLFEQVEQRFRQTMTFDNGKEFSGHQKLADELGVLCFFATPYHSWERGLNEHTNGLLRQFFPKGTNFKIVQPQKLAWAVDLINRRPRKSLDYRTPHEVFYPQPSAPVALQI